MRIEEVTFIVQYKMFDQGERVTPTSSRCPLPPGTYGVLSCQPPVTVGDGEESVVFVEGHKYGVSAAYLTSADV